MSNSHKENVIRYLKEKIIIPRDWKDEDIILSYTKNLLIHPYDTRNYTVENKENGKTVYTKLTLEELRKNEGKTHSLSWENVFNSKHKFYGDIFKCFEIVKETGYEYFTFENKIYQVLKDNSFITIEHSIDDIK